jgi:hypothetical protein
MSSNTSKGRGRKGSKFWIQTLVNIDYGSTLSKAIQSVDSSIGDIKWLSPLKRDNYKELKSKQISSLTNADFSFWPDNGPWWDSVGVDDVGSIVLVEAKGHIAETKTKCKASSERSLARINKSMEIAHNILTSSPEYGIMASHSYDKEVWLKKYYQIGNRLSFLVKLRQQGFNVKLILLNLVNDSTHISTSLEEWERHYEKVFQILMGTTKCPSNVVVVNFDVD